MIRARRAAVVCCTLGSLVATPGTAAQAPPGKLAASLARLFGAHARRAHGLAGERGDPMSDAVAPLSWRVVPAPLRTLARWITIVQLVGYTTSLVYVWHTTRLTPPGIEARYRGTNPEAGAAAAPPPVPQTFSPLVSSTHTPPPRVRAVFVLSRAGVGPFGVRPR